MIPAIQRRLAILAALCIGLSGCTSVRAALLRPDVSMLKTVLTKTAGAEFKQNAKPEDVKNTCTALQEFESVACVP